MYGIPLSIFLLTIVTYLPLIWNTRLVFQISGRYVTRIQVIQGAQLQWKRMERRRSFPRLVTGFFHIKMADVASGKINKKEAKTVMQTLRSYTLSMFIFSKMPCKYPQYNVSSRKCIIVLKESQN